MNALKISRNRFKSRFLYSFHYNRNNKKKANKYIFIFALIFLFALFYFVLDNRIVPLAKTLAESKVKKTATLIINQTVSEIINTQGINYNDLYTIEKNNDGQISAMVANMVKINYIKSTIILNVQEKIINIDSQEISIPMGSLMDNYLLSTYGPKIPIKFLTVGDIKIDFNNSFISAGINQTKHEIILNATARVTAIMPIGKIDCDILTSIPLTEAIIVGTVPNTYFNIENNTKE